jgi:hypothetical protein
MESFEIERRVRSNFAKRTEFGRGVSDDEPRALENWRMCNATATNMIT